MKRAVLYLRAREQEQMIETRRAALEQVAAERGWRIVGTFRDDGVSSSFGREVQAQYDAVTAHGARAHYDVVMAWDIGGIATSLSALSSTLDQLHACGVDLYLHQQGVDTTMPAGKAMFQMCGMFAAFQGDRAGDRIKAGLQRARQDGRVLGRPVKVANMKRILDDRNAGKTIREIARRHNLSVGKIHKILNNASG